MARYGIRILAAAIVVGMGCLAWLPARFVQRAQLTTEDRLKQPVFWPRKTAASAEDFEGVAGCASCHASIANSQRATPMALTAMLAKDSADLQAHAALEFSSGGYHYKIKTKAGESSYSVTDGTDTLKTTLVGHSAPGRSVRRISSRGRTGKFLRRGFRTSTRCRSWILHRCSR